MINSWEDFARLRGKPGKGKWYQIREAATESKRGGDYQSSLVLWQMLAEESDTDEERIESGIGKALVLVILGRVKEARDLLESDLWAYLKITSQGKMVHPNLERKCSEAFMHFGYCLKTWEDSDVYLRNLKGERIEPDNKMTASRVLLALRHMKKRGCKWTPDLEKWEKVWVKVSQTGEMPRFNEY